MTLDLDRIRNTYAQLDDSKLTFLATREARTLEPAVVEILLEELAARGLDPELTKEVELAVEPISDVEMEKLLRAVEALPCPECGKMGMPVRAALIDDIRTYLVVTTHARRTHFGCPDCLSREQRSALLVSVVAGLWSPFGIFRAPFMIVRAIRTSPHRVQFDDAGLRDFIDTNITWFRRHGFDQKRVFDSMRKTNRRGNGTVTGVS